MNHRTFFRLTSWLAFICVLVPGASARQSQEAQEPQDTAPPRTPTVFTDTMNVEVVNVDVYVRDKDGNPVTGLTSDDFKLFVDGKPAAISNFYAVAEESQKLEIGETAEDADVAPNAQTDTAANLPDRSPGLGEATTPASQRLHVVIYIDNYNLTPFKRNQVLRELRQFLRQELSPEDEVMLATYDRALHMRHPFTARPENISRALLEIEEISAQRIHLDRERIDVLRRIEEADSPQEGQMYAEQLAGSIRNDTSFTVDALRSVVENLAASPGRKALIYVSEGLPMMPGEDLFQQVQMIFKENFSMNRIFEYDLSKRFDALADLANANRVSFYTVDARGLTVISQGTVDYEIKGEAGERAMIDRVNTSNLQSTVQYLAERTGGRAIINTNRFLPDLKRIGTDFRNYYSLGYSSADVGDGRYHRIEIKLEDKGKGWTVRHRDGYRSRSVETRMHDGTLSALNLGIQDNPLDIRLAFGEPEPQPNGLYSVPFRIVIPFDSLTLLPAETAHIARLRVWFAAKAENDEISDVKEIPLDLNIPIEMLDQMVGKPLVKNLPLTLEEGYQDIAVGIRDEIGQRHSFLRTGLTVGS